MTQLDTGDGFGLHFLGLQKDPNKPTSAEANPPDPTIPQGAWGDNWFNHSSYNTPTPGSFAYGAGILHELGHALGLKHGHSSQPVENQFGQVLYTNPALAFGHDSQEYSIMTYRTYVGANINTAFSDEYPSTLMQDDILALQWMYGINYAHNSGNTVYTWNNANGEMSINGVRQGVPFHNKILMTIWDGGGVDSYSFANFTTTVTVNLNPGEWSTPNLAMRADLDSTAVYRPARGSIANAVLFQGDNAGFIENASGGSNHDKLTGNIRATTLKGNGGNDNLVGGFGNDLLFGDAGNDSLTGGINRDFLYGGVGTDQFYFYNIYDSRPGATNIDVIADFTRGEKINLSAIDANTVAAANQQFTFVLNFTGVRGQLQWDSLGNNLFQVTGDINGDLAADFALQIKGATALGSIVASDFYL